MIRREDLTVGQMVWVGDVHQNPYHPREPKQCSVTKIGRLLVTIDTDPARYHQFVQFRLDTQRINDGYGHQWFKTDPQKKQDEREASNTKYLKDIGVSLSRDCSLSGEDRERLVRLLREWGVLNDH